MPIVAGSTCRPITESLSAVANPLESFACRCDRSRPERIQWTSGQFTVEGWFFRPDATAPYPVITLVHGGPIDLSEPGFDPTIEQLRDAGFAVFAPNYTLNRRNTTAFRPWIRAVTQ
jgi:dipeptidyl aminopeptidase/acylaminoacyl peptidase